MTWWEQILINIAVEIGLPALEQKFPGLKVIIDAIIALLKQGVPAADIKNHLDNLPK